MDTAMVILIFAAIVLVWLLIKWGISAGVNKGVNAAANAVKRAQEKNNPPKTENLADRYKTTKTDQTEKNG